MQATPSTEVATPSMIEVAHRFCAAAREGRVVSDDQVRARDLMSWFGATRTAARGAIGILRREGLLVPDLRGRLVLRLPTRAEVREIMALRMTLEPLFFEIAIQRLSDADLELMRDSVTKLRTAIVDGGWDVDRAASTTFNGLARMTQCSMLLRMISDLQHDSRRYRALLEDPHSTPISARESDHLDEMWGAVLSRDVDTARRLHRTAVEMLGSWVLERLPESSAETDR